MEKHILISVGRQFGSGGKAVAKAMGEKLGIPVYDNELLSEAASNSGFSRSLFEKSDERRSLFTLGFDAGNTISSNEMHYLQGKVMREIARKGSGVFVGRASDFILRDMECLDVFVCAPLEWRKKYVAARDGISEEEAAVKIRKRDRIRESFYNGITFEHWGVASNYDLCVDASILGIDGTADYIIEFGKKAGLI